MKIPLFTDILGPAELPGPDSIRTDIPTVGNIAKKCNCCGLCRNDCDFLKKYGLPGNIATDYRKHPAACRILAFACSLCGLCTALCPLDLDPVRMFLELRRDAFANGEGELARHGQVLNYEKRGTSKRYTWRTVPKNCTSVFFPGCTLPGTRPKRTLQLYSYLQSHDSSMGIVLDCCSKPSHDLGRQKLFERRFFNLYRNLLSAGVKRIITACPNCYKVFSQYGRDLEITTIYEHLIAEGFIAKCFVDAEVTVHDPCVTRDNSRVHDAVRTLIRSYGLTVREMEHTKEKTLCCGEGGAVGCINKNFSRQWENRRRQEAEGRPIITYCAGCAAKLRRSTPTCHLLDLLFEPERSINGKVRVCRSPFTYLNRLRLKRILQRQE
jgi:Fe-S oxidoreductase